MRNGMWVQANLVKPGLKIILLIYIYIYIEGDGLIVFKNTIGLQSEKIKKNFQKKFTNKGLVIIVNCKMKIVDYLDVMLDLHNRSYRPYKMPNEKANDIHVKSDNHSYILKQHPVSVEKRLSSLLSSKEIFEETAP